MRFSCASSTRRAFSSSPRSGQESGVGGLPDVMGRSPPSTVNRRCRPRLRHELQVARPDASQHEAAGRGLFAQGQRRAGEHTEKRAVHAGAALKIDDEAAFSPGAASRPQNRGGRRYFERMHGPQCVPTPGWNGHRQRKWIWRFLTSEWTEFNRKGAKMQRRELETSSRLCCS